MTARKTAEPREMLKALTKQCNMGKGILQHQPVERKTCEHWTARTREILAESLGADAKVYRDFLAANRRIFTSYDTDPSYYLTQVVANLHRELRVLETCIAEKEREAEAAEALLALKGRKKTRKATLPAFVWAESESGVRELLSFLASEDFDVTAAGYRGTNGKDALFTVASRKDLRYAVAVLSPSEDAGGALSPDGLIMIGYLNGRLGRGRVLVLIDGDRELPPVGRFFRAFALKDTAQWQAEIRTDGAKLRG